MVRNSYRLILTIKIIGPDHQNESTNAKLWFQFDALFTFLVLNLLKKTCFQWFALHLSPIFLVQIWVGILKNQLKHRTYYYDCYCYYHCHKLLSVLLLLHCNLCKAPWHVKNVKSRWTDRGIFSLDTLSLCPPVFVSELCWRVQPESDSSSTDVQLKPPILGFPSMEMKAMECWNRLNRRHDVMIKQ